MLTLEEFNNLADDKKHLVYSLLVEAVELVEKHAEILESFVSKTETNDTTQPAQTVADPTTPPQPDVQMSSDLT